VSRQSSNGHGTGDFSPCFQIIWIFYFTSEEDSLQLYILNLGGTGGLTPPGRNRRRTTMNRGSIANNNGYGGGPIGGGAAGNSYGGGMVGSGYNANLSPTPVSRNFGGGISNADAASGDPANTSIGAHAPLMTGEREREGVALADTSAGSHHTNAAPEGEDSKENEYRYKAKALYACKLALGSTPLTQLIETVA
jgi:SHO1 osmosensor